MKIVEILQDDHEETPDEVLIQKWFVEFKTCEPVIYDNMDMFFKLSGLSNDPVAASLTNEMEGLRLFYAKHKTLFYAKHKRF